MTLRPGECSTCGHPNLRPDGHAEWCGRVTAFLLADDVVCVRCGKDCTNPAGLAAHRKGSQCVPTLADSSASHDVRRDVVEADESGGAGTETSSRVARRGGEADARPAAPTNEQEAATLPVAAPITTAR